MTIFKVIKYYQATDSDDWQHWVDNKEIMFFHSKDRAEHFIREQLSTLNKKENIEEFQIRPNGTKTITQKLFDIVPVIVH